MSYFTSPVSTGQEITGLESEQSGKPDHPWRDKPIRQAVLNACQVGAWEIAGGLPLVARSLYWMRKLGIEDVVILSIEKGS
jgi:hypothetical protein